MASVINNVIGKNEVRFWMGIIAVIVTLSAGFWSLKIDVALNNKDIKTLSDKIDQVGESYNNLHTKAVKHETAIAVIMSPPFF